MKKIREYLNRHIPQKINEFVSVALAGRYPQFNSYFSFVSGPQSTTNVNTGCLNIHDQSFACPLLSELTLSVNEVAKCLMDKKACGPDEIPASRRLKECANKIAPSLCMMFNTSLKTACLTKQWKEANITPVHKRL